METTSSEYVEDLQASKSPGRHPLVAILICIILVSIVGFAFYLAKPAAKPSEPAPQTQAKGETQEESKDKLLINHVGNFDNLSVNDLPMLVDLRNTYEYNNHKILFGYGKIIEYDLANKIYIRMNDTAKLACLYSSAKIDDFLYVACNVDTVADRPRPISSMYKVDLKTGTIVSSYFGAANDRIYPLTNIELLAEGHTLWISSNEGVYKMNIDDETKFWYPASKIFPNSCYPGMIKFNDTHIRVSATATSTCEQGVSEYDPATDTWKFQDIKDQYVYTDVHDDLKKVGIDLPEYSLISPLINGKYYLFATDGVYSLKKGEFPDLVKPAKLNTYMTGAEIYISPDEKRIVIISPVGGMGNPQPQLNTDLFADSIDLSTGDVTDLLDNKEFDKPLSEEQKPLVYSYEKNNMQWQPNGFVISNPETQLTLQYSLESNTLLLK